MPLSFSDQVRIAIDVQDETVTFICRQPTGKEVSEFLSRRFITKRNKVQSRLYEAREEFVNRILLDVENAQYKNAKGEVLPLTKDTQLSDEDKRFCSSVLGTQVETWKDLIPLNWKCGVALHFEDTAAGDEAGN